MGGALAILSISARSLLLASLFVRGRISLSLRRLYHHFLSVTMAIVFIVPNGIVGFLQAFFSSNTAYSILLIIGIGCIITNKLWLRNVYKRLMKRKYINLESFVATR